MSAPPNYYTILGLTPEATTDDVRRAYHAAARHLHPDRNLDPDANEVFLLVQMAYDVLIDAQRRAEYDSQLARGLSSDTLIQINVQYSRNLLYQVGEPQLVYTLLELAPGGKANLSYQPPLNVCLVIDRSTSMRGERMDMVKAAAIELVRQMNREDILSLVTFSDRARVLKSAERHADHSSTATQIRMLEAGGGTEILQGLEAGLVEVRRNLRPTQINHLILLTDGRTYGDEAACLELARKADELGIGISGIGIGEEWNDVFLDELTGLAGGSSVYISRVSELKDYLEEKFRSLSRVYANQVTLDLHTGLDVQLKAAFRLRPESSPLPPGTLIHIGSIPQDGSTVLLLEFLVNPITEETNLFTLALGKLSLVLPALNPPRVTLPIHLARAVKSNPPAENPPLAIIQAMSRVILYRLQERAHQSISAGNVEQAGGQLERLATQLLLQGETELADTVIQEARRLGKTHSFSESGEKRIKYGTRALLLSAGANFKDL